MSGSLQAKMYGHQKHATTLVKKAGHYNGAAMRRVGHYNGTPKKIGHYNGAGASKGNMSMEAYPHY